MNMTLRCSGFETYEWNVHIFLITRSVNSSFKKETDSYYDLENKWMKLPSV